MKIPTYGEANERQLAMTAAALDLFVSHNEPAGIEDETRFRFELQLAVDEVEQEVLKNHIRCIPLTVAELQSGLDRVRWAELLIRQLPEDHEGRNSWLLNYGRGETP